MKTRTGPEDALRCSFCHKSQDNVAKLISSPSDYPRAYICDECVAVCNSILEDDRGGEAPAANTGHLPKPTDVKSFLDDYVIGRTRPRRNSLSPCTTTTSAYSSIAPAITMLS